MIKAIKKVLPVFLKARIRKFIKFIKYNYRKYYIKWRLTEEKEIKIILGAAETVQRGWFSTNEQWLDITNEEHWKKIFQGRVCLSHVVAEHVFEHLTYQEAQTALAHIKNHMIDGGRIRIAVPDGYHPDPVYLKHVGINGIGDDAADHKQLLNVDVLRNLLEEAGFLSEHLEGYNAAGGLVQKPVDWENGFIMRSRSNDQTDTSEIWGFPDSNTSLIVDGRKN